MAEPFRAASPLRVVFMGTPDYAVPTLKAVADRHDVVSVYSQPPRAAGRRGLKLTPSPVHAEAERRGLEVRMPVSLKGEDEQKAFASLEADVAVVVAYGLILPQPILDAPKAARRGFGCLNGHASLLPRWRGAAPIQRAIMAGDRETGVCIMGMERGLDTGPVALSEAVAIDETTTAGTLHDTLAALTARLMAEALARLPDLTFEPQPEEGVTYAAKIEKNETRIDWSRPAKEVHRHVMGLSPVPGAWFERDGRVKVLETRSTEGDGAPGEVLGPCVVACGTEAVRVVRMQKAGGKALDAERTAQAWDAEAGVVLG